MSPTEADLRRALSDGEPPEGQGVDADAIIARGTAQRAQRRGRVLSVAAAVVLVAGLATGGAFLLHHGGSDDAGASKDAPNAADTRGRAATNGFAADSANAPGPASSAAASSAAGASSSPASSGCPATYPSLMLPGGGSPGQFGSSGPLFASTPASILVCAYGADGATGVPATLRLSGGDASALAASLENATTTRTYLPCPASQNPRQNRLVLIGTTASGEVLRPVTTEVRTPQCSVTATNGTAVRYNWGPPSALEPVLLALTPRQDVQNPSDLPPHSSKSPVR